MEELDEERDLVGFDLNCCKFHDLVRPGGIRLIVLSFMKKKNNLGFGMDGRVLILFSSSDEDDDELRDRLPLLEVVTKAWLVEKLLDGDEIEGDEIGGLALSTGLPLLPVTGCRSAQVSAPLRWKNRDESG